VQSGSQGIVVAVLFIVRKSLICVKRWPAVFLGSVIVMSFYLVSVCRGVGAARVKYIVKYRTRSKMWDLVTN
jgi:hypothetical protein